jgi:hypothetical protein
MGTEGDDASARAFVVASRASLDSLSSEACKSKDTGVSCTQHRITSSLVDIVALTMV